MPEETILTEPSQPNNAALEPKITQDDHSAFDSLADTVFGSESSTSNEAKPDVVQKPITETTPESKKVEGEVQKPNTVVTETPEQKAAKEKAAKEAASPKPDPDLDKIQPPRNISPKNLEGWNALRGLAKQRGEEAAALKKELETLRPQIGKPAPELQQKLTTLEQELNRYKAVVMNERSPEFTAKYDAPIQKNDAVTEEILTRNGLPKEMLEKLRAAGFNSPQAEKFFEEQVLPNIPRRDRMALQSAIDQNYKLHQDRQKELEEIKAKPEEFQKKIQQEQTQQFQAYTKQMADHVTAVTKDIPWCQIQPIPPDATPEQKAQLEAQNKFYKESEERFQRMLYPANAVTRVETALAACLSFKLASDLEQVQAYAKTQSEEVQRLQGELDAIKKAGVTSRSGNNISKEASKKTVDTSSMSDDDAIEAGLNAIGA